MHKIEYSHEVKRKLTEKKNVIKNQRDIETANRVLSEMIQAVDNLQEFPQLGIDIRVKYEIDSDYWILITHDHYFIYRFDEQTVTIVNVFHEKEDAKQLIQDAGVEVTEEEMEQVAGGYNPNHGGKIWKDYTDNYFH